MASIDIGKLVQESVMATSEGKEKTGDEGTPSGDIDVKKIEESIMGKVKDAAGSAKEKVGNAAFDAQFKARGLKKSVPHKAKGAYVDAKKVAGTPGAKAAAAGAAGLAAGAGAIKGIAAYKARQQQSHAEALRQAAKEKLASAQEKAGSMGQALKSTGSAVMDKIKENPKAAAGIAAGTAGAIGAGLAAKKLMKMRKAKAA